MTPSQLEHLRLIDAHLKRLLDIAAKRTPGEWKAESSRAYCADESVTHNVVGPPSDFMYLQELPDATFIASCAGNAEAGWRAVRAAIKNGTSALNELGVPQPGYPAPVANAVEFITQQLESILAAFPLESLSSIPAGK